METETNRTIYGSVLPIGDGMRSDQDHSLRCTAYNTVADCRKQVSDTVTFTITGRPQIPTQQSIIISITVPGAVCFLVLTLYICNKRRLCKRGNSINPRSSNESSIQNQEHEIVTEFNVQYGNCSPSINSRISNDSSIQHQDYEIVPESSVQDGDSKYPPIHQPVKKAVKTIQPKTSNMKVTHLSIVTPLPHLHSHRFTPIYTYTPT